MLRNQRSSRIERLLRKSTPPYVPKVLSNFIAYGVNEEYTKWQTQLFERTRFADRAKAVSRKCSKELPVTHWVKRRGRSIRSTFDQKGRKIQIQVRNVYVTLVLSERNPLPLFGTGLIEQIPEMAIEEVAAEQARATDALPKNEPKANDKPTEPGMDEAVVLVDLSALPVRGRVARLRNGRVGRFGWKGQMSNLREFTLQACSSELGLEVPGFPRAVPPWKKEYEAPGLDLSAEQCDRLTHYVASLAKPVQRHAETPQHAAEIAAGKRLFSNIGCAACHRPKLGDLDGLYSDLLLHDMGQLLSDAGSYGTNITVAAKANNPDPLPVIVRIESQGAKEQPPKSGATRPGMADAASLGPARFRTLFARWKGRLDHERSGFAWWRRHAGSRGILQTRSARASAG